MRGEISHSRYLMKKWGKGGKEGKSGYIKTLGEGGGGDWIPPLNLNSEF